MNRTVRYRPSERVLGEGVKIRQPEQETEGALARGQEADRIPLPREEKPGRARHRKPKKRAAARAKSGQTYFDYNLIMVIVFLTCFGLVMLYSASSYSAQADFSDDMSYFIKQTLISVVSFGVMMIVARIDYHVYGAFAMEIYVVAMIMMALVQTPLGTTINGARRWIQLPANMTLQPSEITKIAVIIFISYEICRLGSRVNTMLGLKRILAYGVTAAAGVFLLTDNLSTAVIVLLISGILFFVAHRETKPFVIFLAIAAACLAVLVAGLAIYAVNSDDFRIGRITTWLDPEGHSDDGGFQVMQGLYAIGSGGFFGKGLGNSTQKLGVIPEAQNDMILTIICEELGVFGAIVVLLLFGMLLYRLMFIARNAPDLFGSLIATGIFAHIALQVVLNIMVVTNMIPTTGVTLPFISYGGTSVLFLMIEMGLALSVSRSIKLQGE